MTPDSRTVEANDAQDAIDIAERRWSEEGLRMDRQSAHASRVGPPELRRWKVAAGVELRRE